MTAPWLAKRLQDAAKQRETVTVNTKPAGVNKASSTPVSTNSRNKDRHRSGYMTEYMRAYRKRAKPKQGVTP